MSLTARPCCGQAHDRLLSKAHSFCASIASQFPSASPVLAVQVSLGAVECTRCEDPAPEGKVFYTARVEEHEALTEGAKLTAVVPNVGTVQFTSPGSSAFTVRLLLPNTVKAPRFALSDIKIDGRKPAPPAPSGQTEMVTEKEHVGATVEPVRRPPVVSQTKPPVSNALQQLSAIGFEQIKVELKGDCFPLSVMAGHEIVDTAAVLTPTSDAQDLVLTLRKAGVGLVAGSKPIGGIESRVFREQEGLKKTPPAAIKEMKPYLAPRFWHSDNAHLSAAFMFGCAAHLQRPTIVFEQSANGILDPSKVYAARDNGLLRTSPAAPHKPETIPSFFPIDFATALVKLRDTPKAYSVLLYDGEEHFDALVHTKEIPTPSSSLIPIPGSFTAVYRKSSKAKVGVRNYFVDMAWSDVMFEGARLSLFVPPLQKAMFTTLQKPTEGNMRLKLEMPSTIKDDTIKLGECGILTSEAIAELKQSSPTKKRPATTAKSPKPKTPKIEEVESRPDFALDGYNVLAPPSEITVETIQNKLVAHRFSTRDWQPGWCVGKVIKRISGKRWNGMWEVEYEGFNPPIYIHELVLQGYGVDQNWVLVK